MVKVLKSFHRKKYKSSHLCRLILGLLQRLHWLMQAANGYIRPAKVEEQITARRSIYFANALMHFSSLGGTVAELAICLCWRSIALAAEFINLIVTQGFQKPDDNGFDNVDKLCVTFSGWPSSL